MKFSVAIDQFFADQRAYGRINSPGTETAYRQVLNAHGSDVGNRDPRTTSRDDVKTTLRRWPHPNTQKARRAALVSFYDWAMEEGLRKDNPARQVPRPKPRPTSVYRLTRAEAAAMLTASMTDKRERWAIHLGICTGLRSRELRGLTGACFDRPGWIHVTPEIAKRKQPRWVPITPDLEPIVTEIRASVGQAEHVLPGSKAGGGSFGSLPYWREDHDRPMSSQTLQRLVAQVAKRAGIQAHIHPHLMRHAYGDHVAKFAGIHNAQALLGHADVGTTQTYVGQPTLEELEAAVAGMSYAAERTLVPSLALIGQSGVSGEGGIRTLGWDPPPELRQLLERLAPADRIELYRRHFEALT